MRPRRSARDLVKFGVGLSVTVVLSSGLSACSEEPATDSAYSSQSATQSQDGSPTPSGGSTVSTNGSASDFASVSGDCGSTPTLTVKTGTDPATSLLVQDSCPGSGAPVAVGGTVTAHYTGIGLNTGKVFDSSWKRGEPIQFPLTGVIQGWSEGIPGMNVGGRRLLVIPGDLAYGTYPPPGSGIEPDETLVFVVDIVSSP